MPAVYRVIVHTSIGLLFIKGLLLVPVTLHAFAQAYRAGKPAPAVGVAPCAAGSFTFGMACLAVWVRRHLE